MKTSGWFKSNKYIYIIILALLLLAVIILYIKNNTNKEGTNKEGFTKNKNKNIILLGDSILNNSNYVKPGFTVNDFLHMQNEQNQPERHYNFYNYAKDESTINDIYTQLSHVDIELNSPSTILFLSVGGNNILKIIPTLDNNNNNNKNINNEIILLFHSYEKLITAIKTRMPQIQIKMFNIYLPPDMSQYHSIILKWNNSLKNKYGHYSIIDLTKIMNDQKDFISGIEPSKQGGEKISNKLISYIR